MLDKNLTIYEMHDKKRPVAPMADMLMRFMKNPAYKVSFYATPQMLQKIVDVYGPVEDLTHIPKSYVPSMIYIQIEQTRFVKKLMTGNFSKEMILP